MISLYHSRAVVPRKISAQQNVTAHHSLKACMRPCSMACSASQMKKLRREQADRAEDGKFEHLLRRRALHVAADVIDVRDDEDREDRRLRNDQTRTCRRRPLRGQAPFGLVLDVL